MNEGELTPEEARTMAEAVETIRHRINTASLANLTLDNAAVLVRVSGLLREVQSDLYALAREWGTQFS